MDKEQRLKLKVWMDSGSSNYFLNPNPEQVRTCLREQFRDVEVHKLSMMHDLQAGTLIQLVLEGIIFGSGILATEIIKEAGKDLWKAFKKLILKKNERDAFFQRPGLGDDLIMLIPVGQVSFGGLVRVGDGSERELERFFVDGLPQLVSLGFDVLDGKGIPNNPQFNLPRGAETVSFHFEDGKWVLAGPFCPNCKHANKNVTEYPCSDCRYQGAKLGFEQGGTKYGSDGSMARWVRTESEDTPPDHPTNDHYEPIQGEKPQPMIWARV